MSEIEKLAAAFGDRLRSALDERWKDAELHGGGYRHGSLEWRASYDHDDLLRVLVFHLEADAFGGFVLRVYVSATDRNGLWAQRDVGSVTLLPPMLLDGGDELLRPILSQATALANALSESDLKPLRIGWDGRDASAS